MHSVFFSSSDAHRNTSSGSQGISPCVKTFHEAPYTLKDAHTHNTMITSHVKLRSRARHQHRSHSYSTSVVVRQNRPLETARLSETSRPAPPLLTMRPPAPPPLTMRPPAPRMRPTRPQKCPRHAIKANVCGHGWRHDLVSPWLTSGAFIEIPNAGLQLVFVCWSRRVRH